MMQIHDIPALLKRLETHTADDLEGQELDFKQWEDNFKDMMKILVRAVVSFANAGEGLVIAGVRERVTGCGKAIVGVPREVDALGVQKSIYDLTEPHITARVQELAVEYGTGRLLAIQVFPGMPPYTTSDGAGWIRVGKENKPLTGSRRREMMESMGYHDATAATISESWEKAYSPAALERLREMMAEEAAPQELLRMRDEDLLQAIGALKEGRLTVAGLLMAGKAKLIEQYVPCHRWAFRKMTTDTEYTVRDEGNDALPLALRELERYIDADNPVSTLEIGFLHPEFKKFPKIAIREGIMNAFAHRDYRVPGAVMVKHYPDELIISSPGELIGGITPDNILHHAPVSRNNALANILEKLRLVNRSNLGVPRIYESMLMEGKETPIYEVSGENVELTLRGAVVAPSLRLLVKQLSDRGIRVEVDGLIILNYLLRHREITAQTAAEICQRSVKRIAEKLNSMEVDSGVLTAGGKGRGRFYMLSDDSHRLLSEDVQYKREAQAEEAADKEKILALLKTRPLSNQELRKLTGRTAQQVRKLMAELQQEGVMLTGKGRGSQYTLEER